MRASTSTVRAPWSRALIYGLTHHRGVRVVACACAQLDAQGLDFKMVRAAGGAALARVHELEARPQRPKPPAATRLAACQAWSRRLHAR